MNCRRVEKLIPLYVEGDIESRSRERIALHLELCGRCNWLADEFRESQSWLRSSDPPEFDEAFLDSFKTGVLKQIAETAQKPSLLSALIQQWSRRQVFALLVAMLVIAGVIVFYVYQASPSARLQVAETTKTPNQDSPELQPAPDKRSDIGLATGAGLREPRHCRNQLSVKPRAGTSLVPTQPNQSPLPIQVSRVEGPIPGSFEPSGEPAGSGDDSPPMLRIEIQTSDPNIRIIWFAPREVDSPKTNQ